MKSRIVAVLALIIFLTTLALCTVKDKAVDETTSTAALPQTVPTAAPPPSISTMMDDYIKAYVEKGWFSGAVLAAQKGEIILSKGYGMANCEFDIPNTPSTKFHLGSITKQFTSMAIMQLQEKGLLSVNDTLSKYIPDYPNGKNITIHHLLTHTSGIPDYINDDTTFSKICGTYHTIDAVIDMFKKKPLEFKPGTRYDYSNSGYVLLSYIIEKVTGNSYEEYLEKNIFKPVGMKNTGYDYAEPIIKNRAEGYSISLDRLVNAGFIDSSNLKGADGLYSTIEDLYLWDRVLYTEKLVSRSTIEKIFTTYPPAVTYGYGWTVNKGEVSHYGRMDGFYNYIYRNTGDGTVIVVLSNIEQAPIKSIGNDLNAIMCGKEYKLPEGLTVIK